MRFASAFAAVFLSCLLLAVAPSAAQPASEEAEEQAYEVPFASKGNVIALTVANVTEAPMQKVQITAAEAPAWLALERTTHTLERIAAGKEISVRFRFAVDKEAPVGQKATLRLEITSVAGLVQVHEIRLRVAPPATFKLYGNYPNPFSRSTTLAYDLPEATRVRIAVYDVLGRRVAVLLDEKQEAGHRKVRFDGGRLSSGIYFYRIEAGDRVETGRMLVVK